MIEYHIQRAGPDDWQRIRAIRLRSLADSPDSFGTTLAEDEARSDAEWRARVENDDVAHFLAAMVDGSCIGMVVGAPYADQIHTAGLFAMWVAPESRGQKVGSALVDAVVSWARNEIYNCLLLDVADANEVAIRLYASCGFSPTGKTGTLPPPRQHISEHERSLSLE